MIENDFKSSTMGSNMTFVLQMQLNEQFEQFKQYSKQMRDE